MEKIKNNTVKKELPITMLITTLFAVLLSDHIFDNNVVNCFTRGDGIVLLLFFSVFLYYLISMSRKKIDVDQDEKPAMSLSKSFVWTIGGIAAIVLGSNAVVDSATYLAKARRMGGTDGEISKDERRCHLFRKMAAYGAYIPSVLVGRSYGLPGTCLT